MGSLRDTRRAAKAYSENKLYKASGMADRKVAGRWLTANGLELKDGTDRELRRTEAENDLVRLNEFFNRVEEVMARRKMTDQR